MDGHGDDAANSDHSDNDGNGNDKDNADAASAKLAARFSKWPLCCAMYASRRRRPTPRESRTSAHKGAPTELINTRITHKNITTLKTDEQDKRNQPQIRSFGSHIKFELETLV